VSTDRWRWAQKAQQLRFTQLDVARRQAETWRNGLAGVTALLGAALVIKGRADVALLAAPYPVVLFTLFCAVLVAMVAATLLAIRAASGAPGDECLLTGEDLERWTQGEVRRVQQAVRVARLLSVAGICALAAAAGTAWLAPTTSPQSPTVHVESDDGEYCGRLSHLRDGVLEIRTTTGHHRIPLTSVVQVEPAGSCE
jgi:hypothetical protein